MDFDLFDIEIALKLTTMRAIFHQYFSNRVISYTNFMEDQKCLLVVGVYTIQNF
jgi:hypothetical protein